MSTSLINTKFYIPPPRPGLVHRPHLIDRMNEGVTRKLTLVSAPAGFGKTTIVAEWIHGTDQPVVWISLDDGDNVLSRFLTYLITAIQQIDRDFGADILAVMQATEHLQLESLMTMFVNQSAAIQKEFVLVLDDYHMISTQSIHDAIDFLLEHLPPNVHLVMIGRVDPPFSLSRLRVGGQLIELRFNDLRFTVGEIAALLNGIMGFDLTDGDIRALETRTEGWIASLQLAALSLQDREDKSEFIAAFSGSHHYVIDYLVDEVMSSQTEEIQKFITQTAILERFCAALTDAVVGITNSKEIIQKLEDANLFLIPLDDARQWFRYHHLFSDFLKQHLGEKDPDNVLLLHKKASYWFESFGLFPEAINQAIAGEDYMHAAQMVEAIGPDMMMQNEFDQLTRWLDAMPPDLVNSWPWLCIIQAWMCQRWARLDDAEQNLLYAERVLENDNTHEPVGGADVIRGQAAAIRALIALNKTQIPQSVEYANQALEYLPADHFNRAVASDALGIAKRVIGDFDGAIKVFLEARRDSLAVGNRILAQAIIMEMGRLLALQGRLHQAADTFREAVQLTYRKTDLKIPYASGACVFLANIYREWNDLETATALLEEGIKIGVPAKMVDAVCIGYAILTRVFLAQGELVEANKACQEANRMIKAIPDPETEAITMTLDCRVRLQLEGGNYLEAERLVREHGLGVGDEIQYFYEFPHIILARVLIYKGRENNDNVHLLSGAQDLIARMLEVSKPVGGMRDAIVLLVLQALAYKAQGNEEHAQSSLEEALVLAEPEGYVRTFVDEGEHMEELLRQAAARGIATDYVGKLLAAFEPVRVHYQQIDQPLIEPLSERELEVLRLLTTELSGPEIARELMVSLNTLRTHTKRIYSKLEVNNRRSAVSKAEELKLL